VSLVSVVCNQVEDSVMGRSQIQSSHTDCVVSVISKSRQDGGQVPRTAAALNFSDCINESNVHKYGTELRIARPVG
jgi:hypothetical protein